MRKREISKKKAQQIEDFKKSQIKVGEQVYVSPELCEKSYKFSKNNRYEVLEINGDELTVVRSGYKNKEQHSTLKLSDVAQRFQTFYIGADPFNRKYKSVSPIAYTMYSICHNLELEERKKDDEYVIGGNVVAEVSWNPFVYNKDGEKEYYQRDFVWTEEDEHLLIDSIYKGISCGSILVRKRSWEQLEKLAAKGETELSFNDIVDGKQRLNTIRKFLNNKITDRYGNYFSDLSNHAQNSFLDHKLFTYAEMNDPSDEEVIYQFLKLNHTGVPQSKEHIDFVSNLLEKM